MFYNLYIPQNKIKVKTTNSMANGGFTLILLGNLFGKRIFDSPYFFCPF